MEASQIEQTFKVGKTFQDYDELRKAFKAFCDETYHPFVIRSRDSKRVLYKCCHGITSRIKPNSVRTNQLNYYKGCEANICVNKGYTDCWRVTKVSLDHNHTIGKEAYSAYGREKRCYFDNRHVLDKMDTDQSFCNDNSFKIGKKFRSDEELTNKFNIFCKEFYHPFVRRMRTNKQIVYKCYYDGCLAQVIFCKGKSKIWRVEKLSLQHSHTIGEEEFKEYIKVSKVNEDFDAKTISSDGGEDVTIIESDCEYVMTRDESDQCVDISTTNPQYEAGVEKVFSSEIQNNSATVLANLKTAENVNPENSNNINLSDRDKFNMALDITKNIAYILSDYKLETFRSYMEELKIIQRNAQNCVSLFTPNTNFSFTGNR